MDPPAAVITPDPRIMCQEIIGPGPFGNTGTKCVTCDEPETQACTECKAIRYCSAKCQEQDWPEHKPLCSQRRNLRPGPTDHHFQALYFPVSQAKPRLLWIRGQPPESIVANLDSASVAALVSKNWQADRLCQLGNPPSSVEAQAHLVVHFISDPATTGPANASLRAWLGEDYDPRHIAPGPLLVAGHKGGEDGEADRLRDFEWKDLKASKAILRRPDEDKLAQFSDGGRDLEVWFRM
nr:hypothetical protein B0A51_14476 [Rachicladosporium sp. CCFEE 5018]